jgi:aminoglycoside phosphotransferase
MMSKKYYKWRELEIDPFKIPFKKIILKKILSYPPAGNDVLECLVNYNNNLIHVFVKIERSKVCDFNSEYNNLNIINKYKLNNEIPTVIEYGLYNNKHYLVLSKKEGLRLSNLINKTNKEKYLTEYGKYLALIHKYSSSLFQLSKKRDINNIPLKTDSTIEKYLEYLKNNIPKFNNDTFIHGDYHYANLLWDNYQVTGLLDLEYSGLGFKEQDIAWACIYRPNQKFMNTKKDIDLFLKGYLIENNFNYESFKWCLINGYCHFYLMNNNENYRKKLLKILKEYSLDN